MEAATARSSPQATQAKMTPQELKAAYKAAVAAGPTGTQLAGKPPVPKQMLRYCDQLVKLRQKQKKTMKKSESTD